jgi:large subunit ribosomal protein L22
MPEVRIKAGNKEAAMGERKRISAEKRKAANKETFFARLNNVPTSPRKMRLIADMIRGREVQEAMYLLEHSPKHASRDMHKLLQSAIFNWEQKREKKLQDEILFVKEVQVNGGRMLKRLQTAPQGRAYRIRKRSNHVTVVLGERNAEALTEVIKENNEQ